MYNTIVISIDNDMAIVYVGSGSLVMEYITENSTET